MWDLYLAVALICLVSVVCWRWGTILGERCSPTCTFAVLAVTVGLYAAYCVFLFGELALTRLLPMPNVIVLSNWLLPGAAFLAGLLYRRREVAAWRRRVLAGALVLGGACSIGDPLLTDPPQAGTGSTGSSVCRQTTHASCSPCAAVTLLHMYGIRSTEAEMMQLCLTERLGTRDLGLFRGLKLKTQGTVWDVEPFRGATDDLRDPAHQPAVLLVRLDRSSEAARKYQERSGWLPGVGHAVVLLGMTHDGHWIVGDPAVGIEHWTNEDLRVLWHGKGIRLVPRDPELVRTLPAPAQPGIHRLVGLPGSSRGSRHHGHF